jgi:2,3-bisphosphoglycerate-dependent phosphoglycerate mutase
LKLAQGHAEVDLNDMGRAQAEAAATSLTDEPIEAVYSSDLMRAVDTARPIADARGLPVVTDAAFREIDQGQWEGLHVDVIKERWPELWGPARHSTTRPGGEAPADVRVRALEGVRRIVESHPDGVVVVVSHGGTIRWLSAEALGFDDERSASIRGVSNGGVVTFDARLEDGRLVLENLVRMDGATTDLDDPND